MPQVDVEKYQTDNYQIHIGSKIEGTEAMAVYEIINKHTGVTEYEDYLLPRVISTMVEMQKRLLEALDTLYKGPEEKPVLTVTSGGKGGHTAH